MKRKKKPSNKELRSFGVLTGAIAVLLFGILFPWIGDRAFPLWPWPVAVLLWVPAILFPDILAPVYRIWMSIGDVLGWINTRIILGILFFGIFLPVGMILRLLGKDPMRRDFNTPCSSYRVICQKAKRNHFERPF
ncbi:MAG: hypothetical protein BWK76_27015 [Desulfobulbaceae bacterium A2]|nr:MAG: hypothetical protein BWK76_27015 [Desulfobulbaceae bacterium A2]